MSLVTPKLYPIVDLDGIDLAEADGHRVPGIYNKISDNLNEDKIEIFYHWYFADIILTPYRVVIDDSVANQYTINNAILVKSDDTVSIIGHTYIPVIESLSVSENGTYVAPSGIDGYTPVVVDVPSNPPVLVQLNATENGNYTPATGVDGFSSVMVNVPAPEPVTVPLSVTENGNYTPATGVDGFSSVMVNVPAPEPVTVPLSVTENGTYIPASGVDGFSPVTVSLNNPNVNPKYTGLSYAYVSSGRLAGYSAKTNYMNFYEVEAGTYVLIAGDPVGNRLRVGMFEGLFYEDFSDYVENPSEGIIYTGINIVDTSTAADIQKRYFFNVTAAGTVAIMTSASSQLVKSYLFKITN